MKYKESACNAGDLGLIPGLGRSPVGGHGNSLQYSCLEYSMNRWAWQAAVHGVSKSWTWLNDETQHSLPGSVQFSSVTHLHSTLCYLMDCSSPGLPVHHQLPEFTQTHVKLVIPSNHHPLPSPSPPAFNLSQHQGLWKWVSSLHQVAKVLEFQLQHQCFQWTFRTDFL